MRRRIGVEKVLHSTDGPLDVVIPRDKRRRPGRLVDLTLRLAEQLFDADAARADGFDYREGQEFGQLLRRNLDAPALGLVHHVQANDHRNAELTQVERQFKAAAE